MEAGLSEVEAQPAGDRLQWGSSERPAHYRPAKLAGPQLRLLGPALGCRQPQTMAPAFSDSGVQHTRELVAVVPDCLD